jgi:hypothetical protein
MVLTRQQRDRLLLRRDQSDSGSGLSDFETPLPSPVPRKPKKRTMNGNLPKFDGSNDKAKSFLNDFDIAMLDRDVEDDAKQAKYFVKCIVPDSRADRWLERLPAATKASFSLLEISFKSNFVENGMTDQARMNTLGQMMRTRIRDIDVGKADSSGVQLTVKYCEEMARLGMKVPLDTAESTKIGAVLTGLGGGLARVVRESNHNTFDQILETIRGLTDYQMREIQHYALVEQLAIDGSRMRRQGGYLSPPASTGTPSPENRGSPNYPQWINQVVSSNSKTTRVNMLRSQRLTKRS